MHGQLQLPAAGFTTCSPETFLLHVKPFKNKVYKTEDRDPGKWSLPGRPFQAQGYLTHARPWQEELARKTRRFHYKRHASALCAPRQGPGSDELQSPTSSQARQGQDPGKVLAGRVALCARAPAHRSTRRPGAIPGTRGGWLCSLGDTVALHGGGSIAVADGDARAGAFGVDGDGH